MAFAQSGEWAGRRESGATQEGPSASRACSRVGQREPVWWIGGDVHGWVRGRKRLGRCARGAAACAASDDIRDSLLAVSRDRSPDYKQLRRASGRVGVLAAGEGARGRAYVSVCERAGNQSNESCGQSSTELNTAPARPIRRADGPLASCKCAGIDLSGPFLVPFPRRYRGSNVQRYTTVRETDWEKRSISGLNRLSIQRQ